MKADASEVVASSKQSKVGNRSTYSGILYLSRQSIAGMNAGIVGTLLGFPLDAIKLRMQLTGFSIFGASSAIYKDGGIPGFYRGVGSPLLALTVLNTLNFSAYNYFTNVIMGDKSLEDRFKSGTRFESRVTLAAVCVAPLASTISTPFELIKTQMQINSKIQKTSSSSGNSPIRFRNSLHAAWHIMRSTGIDALYKAHMVNTLREAVFLATYFTVYEHFKYGLLTYGNFTSLTVVAPIAGGFAGSIGWFISFPLDCIKAQLPFISVARRQSYFFRIKNYKIQSTILLLNIYIKIFFTPIFLTNLDTIYTSQ